MTHEDYEQFAKRMEQRFPLMFGEPYGGFAVSAGWWPILEALCVNIQSHIDWQVKQGHEIAQVTVSQIKEKFGGLRFYYEGGDDQISGMVRMAEAWADVACEECGAAGTRRSGGWIRNLCDNHEAQHQERVRLRQLQDEEQLILKQGYE